ncbi:MAG: hypothetical protein ACYCV4_15675 [Dermatophilaceae bacterium]
MDHEDTKGLSQAVLSSLSSLGNKSLLAALTGDVMSLATGLSDKDTTVGLSVTHETNLSSGEDNFEEVPVKAVTPVIWR